MDRTEEVKATAIDMEQWFRNRAARGACRDNTERSACLKHANLLRALMELAFPAQPAPKAEVAA